MGTRDSRIDQYIDEAAEFARPILRHLREVVHAASPEIEETVKWSAPHFTYHGNLCHMAAFKQHCAFGFWKGKLIFTGDDVQPGSGMGAFGRITSISDLPSREALIGYVRQAMELNEKGVKVPAPRARVKETPLEVPEAFRVALDRSPQAAKVFEGFSPSQRKEYVEWIAEARREETQSRRIATAIEWIAEGKQRNWKYMKR